MKLESNIIACLKKSTYANSFVDVIWNGIFANIFVIDQAQVVQKGR